jgi:hypothetical protein
MDSIRTSARQTSLESKQQYVAEETSDSSFTDSSEDEDEEADLIPALTERVAQLSAVDSEFLAKWQQSLNTGPAELSSIQVVYNSCLSFYHTMLRVWLKSAKCEEEVWRILYRNYLLLRDWGISYSVLEGELDQLPEEADDLVETLLSFLHEIYEVLKIKHLANWIRASDKHSRIPESHTEHTTRLANS